MRLPLAVKYRPSTFKEMVSQTHTVAILEKQLETNTFKNAYLFTGGAGTGKTTLARLMAARINNNQGSPIEIDAASNNSAEHVRNIVEDSTVKALDSYYKVYILDECHAFSNTAWQAFLKCIEEPPLRTIFIFCTTDPQKIPATILSRVQRFNFQRIPINLVIERLRYICEQEGFKSDLSALEYIAKITEGGLRDAITALDKVFSYDSNITLENVTKALGVTDYSIMFELTNHIIYRKELECLNLINDIYNEGKDLKLFLSEYVYFLLDVLKYILSNDFATIKIPQSYIKDLTEVTNIGADTKPFYDMLLDRLVRVKEDMRWETNIKPNMELNILKLCRS